MSALIEGLPSSWAVAPLGDVVEVLDRFRVPVNSHERAKRPGSIPYYGATGQVGWIDDYIFDQELILLGEDGAPFLDPSKPKAYIVRGKSWVNNHAHALAARQGILNAFLLHQLNQSDYRAFVSGTTRLKLPQKPMLSMPVRIAPVSEQQRIVEELEKQLTRIEAAESSLRRVRSSLKRYRESVLVAACSGRLVPTEAELARVEGRGYESAEIFLGRLSAERKSSQVKRQLSPPEIGLSVTVSDLPVLPEGWAWTRLDCLLAGIEAGKNFKCEERPPSEREVGVVKVSAVTWGEFDETQSKTCTHPRFVDERLLIREGDFLFSRANTLPLVGACVIAGKIWRRLMLSDKILRFSLSVPPSWILYALRSPYGRKEIENLATGNQESMRNISQEKIRKIRIPLPPAAELLRIKEEIERQFSIGAGLEDMVSKSIERARRLRQAILRHAFEGNLIPQNSNDEPASALLERIRRSREESTAGQAWPRRGRGIKPGASAPGPGTKNHPEPRRGDGSVHESAFAPPGLPDELDGRSLGLKPQALRRGPSGATVKSKGTVPESASIQGSGEANRGDFRALSRPEQIAEVWEALFGRGAIEKDEAIRIAAHSLRDKGLADFQRLRQGGPLYEAIASAINRGVREGSFDRPKRGFVRALLADARDYTEEDWRQCILGSLDHEQVSEDEALRSAAEWARENMGLDFARLREDGVILRGLRSALKDAIRDGEVRRARGMVCRPPKEK